MFHWTDGLYFGRKADGSVRIIKKEPDGSVRIIKNEPDGFPLADGGPVEGSTLDVTIPAAEWASIVSAVSKDGEATAYQRATELHGA